MRLTDIVVYPIKSARGIHLAACDVDAFGLAGDRRFMVVDGDGHFRTLRRHPRMALIDVRREGDQVALTAPGMDQLEVPSAPSGGAPLSVIVWDDTCAATRVSDAADAWLTRFLGVSCRLVYMPDDVVRPVDPKYASATDQVSFADGFSLLLTSTGSLADLNTRFRAPTPMARFRPNVVVDAVEPWVEDRWRRLRIGTLEFDVVKPCARCVAITVDPQTAEMGTEPLRTLATFRSDSGKVLFGQNLVHRGRGRLRVGDAVEVLEWADGDAA